MKIHRFVVGLLMCATGCPGGGEATTGPGTTAGDTDGPTASTPTTSASAGDPTSMTEPSGTTAGTVAPGTDPGETGPSTGDTDAGVESAGTTESTAGTVSVGTVGDTETTDSGTVSAGTVGDTGTAGDTDTEGGETGSDEAPPPGSVDCPALEFEEPIILDDYSDNLGPKYSAAVPLVWREDMVIARALRGQSVCSVAVERRDDAGQKLGETVMIPVPATGSDDTAYCESIGDLIWDGAHQRYIFIHPLQDGNKLRALPLAITADGQLVWTASGETRIGNEMHGVASQLRIVGDELLVMGQDFPNAQQAKPIVHVYSTVDGAWLRTIAPPLQDVRETTVVCDETCTLGLVAGEDFMTTGKNSLWRFDMATGALIGEPKRFENTSMYGPPMVDWRADTVLITRVLQYFEDTITIEHQEFVTDTVIFDSPNDGTQASKWMPEPPPFEHWDYYEPAWVRTDDGYVIVTSRFLWHSGLNVADFRKMRVQLWNVGFDGKIREMRVLPDERAHSPRIAMKNGRVAITYAHVHQDYDHLHSNRLVFASCPP